MPRGVRFLTVVLLSLSLGCPWTLVQGFAWVSMFAGHVRTESVPVALTRTFDGQHPCKICKVVRAGKSAEEKSPAQSNIKKLDPVPLTARRLPLFVVAIPISVSRQVAIWTNRGTLPPVPPPRCA